MSVQNKSVVLPHLAVLSANLLFGINFSMVKLISPSLIAPAALNLVRVIVTSLLFWILFLFQKNSVRIQKKDRTRLALCALFGVTINQLFFIKGLTLSTPIHGALLILATPVFILLFSLLMRTESFTRSKGIGLILAICGGIVLIRARSDSAIGSNIFWGDILITINAISYAIYFLLAKPLIQEYGPLPVIRTAFSLGFLMMLPFCWTDFINTKWTLFHIQSIAALAFIVVGSTFFAYLFTAYGLHRLSPSATGSYIYVQPVFSAAVSVLFLGEEPALYKLLAAFLIFTGVFLINRQQLKKLKKPESDSVTAPSSLR
jgi:drug/metabolite transporter (DMT)-like permease